MKNLINVQQPSSQMKNTSLSIKFNYLIFSFILLALMSCGKTLVPEEVLLHEWTVQSLIIASCDDSKSNESSLEYATESCVINSQEDCVYSTMYFKEGEFDYKHTQIMNGELREKASSGFYTLDGSRLELCEAFICRVYHMAWSSDGKKLVFSEETGADGCREVMTLVRNEI